ncbi:hypothetical protein B566_EDAN005905 [Ephemera danica]|nr:hypothetical protein B566_EDAN005905 [Ephemera danica]
MQQLTVLFLLCFMFCTSVLQGAQETEEQISTLLAKALHSLAAAAPSATSINRRITRATKASGKAAVRWRSCGNRKDPVQLQRLDVRPNPVRVPGPLSIDLALLVREPIPAPLKVQLRVSKEVELPLGLGSTWFELPCPNGACAVLDACASALLPREGAQCPAPQNSTEPWRPCECPIPKGLYVMPPLQFNLTRPARNVLPEFLLNGGVQAQVRLSRHKRRVACLQTTLDLDL